jgi:hypothetical protein
VRGWLDNTGHGGAVFASPGGFAWATAGGHAHVDISSPAAVAWVLVTRDGAWVTSPNIEHRRLLGEELPGGVFEGCSGHGTTPLRPGR